MYRKLYSRLGICCLIVPLVALLSTSTARAQTTTFTYQGRLVDGGTAANGNYDFEFKLFDAAGGGTQIGATLTRSVVLVANGVFTVTLDFGASAFPGANRFLEIGVRATGGGTFTTLSPRQQITSANYGIRSISAATADTATNATQLGGVAANQYVQTNDSRLSDPRAPTAGNSNYIQNTNVQQAGSNFNITGNGTAGETFSANNVNATTQYNIGGSRLLSVAGTNNMFAGVSAGSSNTTGFDNAFFGRSAGLSNTTGTYNSFFGRNAGFNNTTGNENSFFGRSAGANNTTASANSFFGFLAGNNNITGTNNAFFGSRAGFSNTTASDNSFFGYLAGQSNTAGNNSFFGTSAGQSNTTGTLNSFFGTFAGQANTTAFHNSFFGAVAGQLTTAGLNSFFGSEAGASNTSGRGNAFFGTFAGNNNTTGASNTIIGGFSEVGFSNLQNATAIGYFAQVDQSNSLVLGSINGVNGAAADTKVGIGTTAPTAKLTVSGAGAFNTAGAARFDLFNTAFNGGFLQHVLDNGAWQIATTAGATRILINSSGDVGIGTATPADNLHVNGIIRVTTLGAAGATSLCRNASNQIATCASSLRYKTNVAAFAGGLDILNRLRPVTFTWKQGGMRDLGLGAEDVAAIEPLLVTRNAGGEVEGVKYDRLNVVLINAIKQQQAQIEKQQKEIESLKKLVCLDHPNAEVCK